VAAPERLEVGRVGRPHGLTGEVAVTFTSNRAERRAVGAVLYADERRLVVASARPHQGRWLVRFDGVTDRDAAVRLRGARLRAAPLEVDERDPDEWWAHELIGAEVLDDEHDGDERPVVEHGAGRVVIDPPAGLLDG